MAARFVPALLFFTASAPSFESLLSGSSTVPMEPPPDYILQGADVLFQDGRLLDGNAPLLLVHPVLLLSHPPRRRTLLFSFLSYRPDTAVRTHSISQGVWLRWRRYQVDG